MVRRAKEPGVPVHSGGGAIESGFIAAGNPIG
jgi:hypothetical protein